QHKLDVVSDEILDLVETVVDRTRKQDEITESTNLHEGLGPAVGRLPAEVLSKIFDYHLMDSDHLSRGSDPSPMQLTRVCRRWRDVAVGTARLWCKLSFYVDEDRREWKQSAFYYDVWLKRSQDCALSLQL
ncbi:hypothetical protein EDB19DRAFT_1582164, partial [Suillus lakei]